MKYAIKFEKESHGSFIKQFAEEKDKLVRNRKESEENSTGFVRNIYNIGMVVLSLTVGSTNGEKRKL